MTWQILKMGAASAQENMDIDRQLLDQLVAGEIPPTWRFYRWRQPAFSYGYAQRIEQLVDVAACQQAGVELVQRPTGGGLVIHGWDLTYTVVAPADGHVLPRHLLASYEQIHRWIEAALRALGVPVQLAPPQRLGGIPSLCLSNVAPYDLMLDGRKVGGGAQRRRRRFLLHQGYLALDKPPERVLRLAGASAETGAINEKGRQIARETLIAAIETVLLDERTK